MPTDAEFAAFQSKLADVGKRVDALAAENRRLRELIQRAGVQSFLVEVARTPAGEPETFVVCAPTADREETILRQIAAYIYAIGLTVPAPGFETMPIVRSGVTADEGG